MCVCVTSFMRVRTAEGKVTVTVTICGCSCVFECQAVVFLRARWVCNLTGKPRMSESRVCVCVCVCPCVWLRVGSLPPCFCSSESVSCPASAKKSLYLPVSPLPLFLFPFSFRSEDRLLPCQVGVAKEGTMHALALALAHAPGPALLPQQAFKLDFLATGGYHFPPRQCLYIYMFSTHVHMCLCMQRERCHASQHKYTLSGDVMTECHLSFSFSLSSYTSPSSV